MHDIKAIRQDPYAFEKAMERRGVGVNAIEITMKDTELRSVQTELQNLQKERNDKSKQIGILKGQGQGAAAVAMMDEVAAIKDKMTALEESERTLAEELNTILSSLPNVLFDEVPDGADENDNVEVRKHGEPKRQNSNAPDHVAIGEGLGMMDFETAAKMSGSRFVLMHSGLARLERALAQLMLDTHTQDHAYTEVSPPLLVRDSAMYGTGQLPKFAKDLFCVSSIDSVALDGISQGLWSTQNRHWLIPTAEVSLTNIVAEEIVEEESLPRRYTAFTPCFRSEAGAAGKDTKGMIRQHQFYKVEMVSIVRPEDSEAEHERMTQCAENILKKLGLPFRTIVLCSGDTGFGAKKTYDIEVWLPGQDKYREISSCSNCGDFQARRMNARTRAKGEKETRFVHTLNGSGLAVGRTLIAVLENYYDPADGGVFVPEVLKPYMGGLEKIVKAS